MVDPAVPRILLVRLKPRLPDGEVVGESRRVCHLVPVPPESGAVPAVLRAYCGAEIAPGSAELLAGVSGMPCESCLAKSSIPAFALLRTLPIGTGDAMADPARDRHDVVGWSDDLGLLRPDQKLAARFVLLLLLQDPTRPWTLPEIAQRLRQDPATVYLILLVHAAAGWLQWTPDHADPAWTDVPCRLTEHGVTLARRVLAHGMTPTVTALATGLGLETTVVSDQDAAGDQ